MTSGLPADLERRFLVILNRPAVGLFASVLQVLGWLHHCRTDNLTPIVFFGDNWPYWSANGHRGARNGWEYYFEPVSPYSIADVIGRDEAYLEHCNIFDYDAERIVPSENPTHVYDLSRRGHLPVPPHVTVVNRWPTYAPGVRRLEEDRRRVFHELMVEFLRPKPFIRAAADSWFNQWMAGQEVIGVHARDAERNHEIESWHGLAGAPAALYFREIDAWLDSHPDGRVLAATDTMRLLDAFRRRYGARLCAYEARRSTGEQAPHKEFGGPVVGEEMLIEGFLLARAQFLVHGISNVPYAALCLAPTLRHVDVYDRYARQLTRLLRRRRAR